MIYLDHAATSFPKPAEVARAVEHWFTDVGVSTDRGDSALCAAAACVVGETRRALARACGVPGHRLAFTSGATEAINLFLRGVLRPGDRVLTTALEHSSVARPLRALQDELGLHLEVLAPDPDGRIDPAGVEARLGRAAHRLLVFTHASNVLGGVLAAEELCAAARRYGCLTLLDAGQTAGLLPLSVGADAVAASAHKSLLGPPGLGFLAVGEGIEVRPHKQGGTGSARALDRQPEEWPQAFEAGTPNTPAIFGLHAALRWREGRPDPLPHGLRLLDRLREGLADRAGVRLLGPAGGPRVPILSFTMTDFDPAEVGAVLAEAGIHVRTGYHCAPWLHGHLGTARGGTVRVSPGPFSTEDDVDGLLRALP